MNRSEIPLQVGLDRKVDRKEFAQALDATEKALKAQLIAITESIQSRDAMLANLLATITVLSNKVDALRDATRALADKMDTDATDTGGDDDYLATVNGLIT